MHSANQSSRFTADVGDILLLRGADGIYFEATIVSIKSASEFNITFSIGTEIVTEQRVSDDDITLILGEK